MSKSNISKLGYSVGSPYRGRPFLDINTPEGLIDMSKTDIPLLAIDETGDQKVLMPFSGMHKFRGSKVREMRMQQGGMNFEQAYDFMFDDDEAIADAPKGDQVPTAPSTQEMQPDLNEYMRQMQEQQQADLAMDAATYTPTKYDFDNNSSQSGQAPTTNGVDNNVLSATNELLQRFPTLRITSTIRNWGDKDAHPKGRAVDLAGDNVDGAWQYYKDVIVPKYGFNPALKPNHGTGKHIHVGYYKKGGKYSPKY